MNYLLVLLVQGLLHLESVQSCDTVMSFKDSMFQFQSPNYPNSLGNGSLVCTLKIEHAPSISSLQNAWQEAANLLCNDTTNDNGNTGGSDNGSGTSGTGGQNDGNAICQVRLDFEEFTLQPPLLGNCQFDKMWVTANGEYPLLCGQNSGQHIYLDVSGKSHTEISFSIDELKPQLYTCPDRFGIAAATSNLPGQDRTQNLQVNVQADDQLEQLHFDTRRAWNIKVTQIPCGCSTENKAPRGCLSYYQGFSGDVRSFNYDGFGCYSHDYMCNAKELHECAMSAGYTGHLNNLDYSICIEEEYGFCGIEYTSLPDEVGSFSMTNKTEMVPEEAYGEFRANSGASNGDERCFTDYLVLPGGHCKDDQSHYSTDRFCGNTLGVNGMSQAIVQYSSPFILQVVTDKDELTGSVDYMNRGFHLHYNQIPCH